MTLFKKKNSHQSVPQLQDLDEVYKMTIMKLSQEQKRHYCKNLLVQSAMDLTNLHNKQEEESIRILILSIVSELDQLKE